MIILGMLFMFHLKMNLACYIEIWRNYMMKRLFMALALVACVGLSSCIIYDGEWDEWGTSSSDETSSTSTSVSTKGTGSFKNVYATSTEDIIYVEFTEKVSDSSVAIIVKDATGARDASYTFTSVKDSSGKKVTLVLNKSLGTNYEVIVLPKKGNSHLSGSITYYTNPTNATVYASRK